MVLTHFQLTTLSIFDDIECIRIRKRQGIYSTILHKPMVLSSLVTLFFRFINLKRLDEFII